MVDNVSKRIDDVIIVMSAKGLILFCAFSLLKKDGRTKRQMLQFKSSNQACAVLIIV